MIIFQKSIANLQESMSILFQDGFNLIKTINKRTGIQSSD